MSIIRQFGFLAPVFVFAALTVFMSGCEGQKKEAISMSIEENKATLRRFLDGAYNKGNLSVGDECLGGNAVFHTPDADIGVLVETENFPTIRSARCNKKVVFRLFQ